MYDSVVVIDKPAVPLIDLLYAVDSCISNFSIAMLDIGVIITEDTLYVSLDAIDKLTVLPADLLNSTNSDTLNFSIAMLDIGVIVSKYASQNSLDITDKLTTLPATFLYATMITATPHQYRGVRLERKKRIYVYMKYMTRLT